MSIWCPGYKSKIGPKLVRRRHCPYLKYAPHPPALKKPPRYVVCRALYYAVTHAWVSPSSLHAFTHKHAQVSCFLLATDLTNFLSLFPLSLRLPFSSRSPFPFSPLSFSFSVISIVLRWPYLCVFKQKIRYMRKYALVLDGFSVCMCLCVYVCMRVRTCTRLYVCVSLCLCVFFRVRLYRMAKTHRMSCLCRLFPAEVSYTWWLVWEKRPERQVF